MQIPPEKIQEILERTDLVALVSRHVKLRQSGRTFLGLCPFHGEKTPSFNVNPERRFFKCFGCDAGGDAITFVQRIGGHSFVEAVRVLAKEAGVHIEERVDPAFEERARLTEANELARRHFEERLWNDPRAQLGRKHLEERQVSPEIARRFGLGYALNGWNDLCERLVKEGVVEWGARAGLCAPRKTTEGFYDVFRGRLMIPIRSAEGRTIAFGARRIEEMEGREPGPKYLNSRDSSLYRKAETLYGLDLAKDEIRKRKTAILVEGYFDVIGLYTAGVRNSVALCSTALTSGHLAALARADAKELVMLLDGDAAGARAVERLAGPILAAGANARVATLPSGDDPDTFALREGLPAVEKLIAQAPALSVHLLQTVLPRGRAHTLEEKMAGLTRLLPVVEQMPSGITRTLFVGEIAAHLGVPESDVLSQIRQEVRPAPARQPAPAAAPAASAPAPTPARIAAAAPRAARAPAARPPEPLTAPEAMLVAIQIAEPELRSHPEARYVSEIRLEPTRVAVRMMLDSESPREALEGLAPELKAAIARQLAVVEQTLSNPDQRTQALRDASRRVRLAWADAERVAAIKERSAALESGADPEEIERLHRLCTQLTEECKRLSSSTPEAGGGVL